VTTAYREQFATLAPADAPWLAALRARAMDRFQALGFPTTRDEDWHYTSVAPIAEGAFRPAPPPAAPLDPDILAAVLLGGDAWSRLVFVNGRFDRGLSRFAELPGDVTVMTLAEALREEPGLCEAHLGRVAPFEAHAFTALNTAFVADGVVLRVPDDVTLPTPIQIVHVADAGADQAVLHPRVLVVAGRHARVAVVETWLGLPGARHFTNAVTEVVVGDGAHVQHYGVQRAAAQAFHVNTVQAVQGRDSVFHQFTFTAGGALSRANVYSHLAAPGAEVRLHGLYLLDDAQHADHQTFVHHAAEGCASREVYKGILDGESHGVFNGKVLVDAVAQKTDGKQSNHALLLSDRARVDSKPQLEIFADDVKCTHGATVGRLDHTLLFYLKSRGVSAETARGLLTYAFAAEVLEAIEVDELKQALEGEAFRRFAQRAEG
jgi:Fe-S cluster assembly protein SufD